MVPVPERATVVVCEDDVPTLELLCDHPEADRFRALPAPCASDALRLCHYKEPDLLLLDLRLPDAPGLDVLREIRASADGGGRFDPGLPVIVLSGRASEADRLRGFTEGADDYVIKPFHYPELAARIRAVLRRRDSRREGPRRIGEIFIDPSRREVRVGERQVSLANKEFSLLCALATEPRRVFTKEELLRDVWGFRSMGSSRR
jgi:DNA-binding response OmpR family regulator